MRSRLEAKWAYFFDLVGWQWEYEPLDVCPDDGPGRIPDFVMRFAHPTIVECKPAFTTDEVATQRRALIDASANWLCAEAEGELSALDAAPETARDLWRIDYLVDMITRVRDQSDTSPHARGALVVGSQIHLDGMHISATGMRDRVSIDGVHAFAECVDHQLGLYRHYPGFTEGDYVCLVCGRNEYCPVWYSTSDVLYTWREAGNRAMWKRPAVK